MPKIKKKAVVKPNKSASRILKGPSKSRQKASLVGKAKKVVKKKPKAEAEEKVASQEFIYDSRVGKTDALFVDEPKPEQIEPEIEEALKEFDTLEQPKQMPTALPPMEKQDEMQMLPKQGSPDIQKKNFWQKLWSFYKK